MFLLFLTAIKCITEVLSIDNMFKTSAFVVCKKNTVLLIETKLNTSINSGNEEKALKNLKSIINISALKEDGTKTRYFVDSKKSLNNTFFFTTPVTDKFLIEISFGQRPMVDKIGFSWEIFVGKESVPDIISNNDVIVEKAELKIKKLVDYVKNNIMMLNIGSDNDLIFKTIHNKIIYKTIFIIIFKIVATFITLGFTSFKTKKFYSSQYNFNKTESK